MPSRTGKDPVGHILWLKHEKPDVYDACYKLLDVPDYLDYLTDDADSKVIAMYIEGVKDGPRFVRSLRL